MICSFHCKVIPNLSYRLLTLKHNCNLHCHLLRSFPGWLIHTLLTFVEFAAFLQFQVRKEFSTSGIILAIYVDSDKLHAIFNPPKWFYPSSNARWMTGWYCILGQYVFEKGQIRNDMEFLFLQKKKTFLNSYIEARMFLNFC